MKTRIISAILLLGWLFPFLPASAENIEIPLAVQASEEPWGDHTVGFEVGYPLPDIATVSLELSGEGGGQEYIGCEVPYPWTHDIRGGKLIVDLRDSDGASLIGRVTFNFGDGPRLPIELTQAFPDADFSALENGAGQLSFDDPASMYFAGGYWMCPLGNGCVLTSATLVVEYGNIVATEETTWGALKAIYR